MVHAGHQSTGVAFARLVVSRPVLLILRRLAIIFIPALAIFFFLQSLWSLSSSTASEVSKPVALQHPLGPKVDHLNAAVHGNDVVEFKAAAREALMNSINSQQRLIPAVDQGHTYRLEKPLGPWREQYITRNYQEKTQKLLSVGSSSAIPHAHTRCPIYTYFGYEDPSTMSKSSFPEDSINLYANKAVAGVNQHFYDSELGILEAWKRAWYAMGFKPTILTKADAEKHPYYSKYVNVSTSSIHHTSSVHSILTKYLSWTAVGAGLLSDYRVFPATRNYDNEVFAKLRECNFSGQPAISIVPDDSAFVAADAIAAQKIVSSIMKSYVPDFTEEKKEERSNKLEKIHERGTDKAITGTDLEKIKSDKEEVAKEAALKNDKRSKTGYQDDGMDTKKLPDTLQDLFKNESNAGDAFAYYSDKNMNLVTFGRLESKFTNKRYDPAYTLTAIRVHLHQIFLGAYPKGVVYVDPVTAPFSERTLNSQQKLAKIKEKERQMFYMTADKFVPFNIALGEGGNPNYNALDILALPAKKIATDLNKCPPLKYSGYTNMCRPTISTIKRIQSILNGAGSPKKRLEDIKSEDVCDSLPCSSAFKTTDLQSHLNKPAKIQEYLPHPSYDQVYSIATISHPFNILYMCMRDPQALPALDFARFYMPRDGLTNALTKEGIFAESPYIYPLYKVKYLKDSMYQVPSKSNVSWIPFEVDSEIVGTLLEWEIGFVPLRKVQKVGKSEVHLGSDDVFDDMDGMPKNFKDRKKVDKKDLIIIEAVENGWEGYIEPISQTKNQLGTRLELIQGLLERSVLALLASNKENKPQTETSNSSQKESSNDVKPLIRPSPGVKKTTVKERLAFIDVLHKWSPSDAEILTFLRLWTERKYKYLKEVTQQ